MPQASEQDALSFLATLDAPAPTSRPVSEQDAMAFLGSLDEPQSEEQNATIKGSREAPLRRFESSVPMTTSPLMATRYAGSRFPGAGEGYDPEGADITESSAAQARRDQQMNPATRKSQGEAAKVPYTPTGNMPGVFEENFVEAASPVLDMVGGVPIRFASAISGKLGGPTTDIADYRLAESLPPPQTNARAIGRGVSSILGEAASFVVPSVPGAMASKAAGAANILGRIGKLSPYTQKALGLSAGVAGFTAMDAATSALKGDKPAGEAAAEVAQSGPHFVKSMLEAPPQIASELVDMLNDRDVTPNEIKSLFESMKPLAAVALAHKLGKDRKEKGPRAAALTPEGVVALRITNPEAAAKLAKSPARVPGIPNMTRLDRKELGEMIRRIRERDQIKVAPDLDQMLRGPEQRTNEAPAPGTLPPNKQSVKDAMSGLGLGVADGLYVSVFKRLQSGKNASPFDKNPPAEQIAQDAFSRGEIKTWEDVKRVMLEGKKNAPPVEETRQPVPTPEAKPVPEAAPVPVVKQPWEMTRREFEDSGFHQHNILNPDAPSVGPEGFKFGIGPNVVRATKGQPFDIMEMRYGTKAGRPVFVVPKDAIVNSRNGPKIKEGWVPGDKIVPSRDYQPLHEAVVAKALAEGKPVPPEVLKDYPDLRPSIGQAAPPISPGESAPPAVLKKSTVTDRADGGFLVSRPEGDLIVKNLGDGIFETNEVRVSEQHRGKGIAKQLYKDAAQAIADKGGKLYTGSEQTADGKRLHDSMFKAKMLGDTGRVKGAYRNEVLSTKPDVSTPNPERTVIQRGKEEEGQGRQGLLSPSEAQPTRVDGESPASDLLGSTVASASRIQVAPIAGVKPEPPIETIKKLAQSLGKQINFERQRGNTLGTYDPSNTNVSVRFKGDMQVVAHEITHWLDDAFGVVRQWARKRGGSPFDAELQPFWQQGISSAQKSHPLWRKRAEGVAEFVRSYINNPIATEQAAPAFTKWWLSKIGDARVSLDAFSQKVREYHGSLPAEKMRTQFQFWEPSRLRRTYDTIFNPEKKLGYTQSRAMGILEALDDHVARVGQWSKDISALTGKPLTPETDPYLLAGRHRRLGAQFETQLDNGAIDWAKSKATGDLALVDNPVSLKDILEPLAGKSKVEMLQGFEDAMVYGASERVIEKAQNMRRDAAKAIASKGLSPAQAQRYIDGIERRIERLVGAGAGLESVEAISKDTLVDMAKDPARLAQARQVMARYRMFADQMVLKPLLDRGWIDKKSYDRITNDNKSYINLERVLEKHKIKLLDTFKGSTKPIGNPVVNLLEAAYSAQAAASKNAYLVAMRNLATSARKMYQGTPTDTASFGHKVNAKEDKAIPIRVNGRLEHWVFEDGVHEALKNADWTITNVLSDKKWLKATDGIFSFFGKTIRATTVWNPMFNIRQFFRDSFDAAIKSKHGTRPTDLFRERHRLKQDIDTMHLAGGGTGLFRSDKPAFQKMLKGVIEDARSDKNRVVTTLDYLPSMYAKLVSRGESARRTIEFRRAYEHAKKKLGYNELNAKLYAADSAADVLDFTRGGYLIKAINRYNPFTNAQFQGMSKDFRSIKDHPQKVFTKWLMYAVIPSLGPYLWAKSQGDDAVQEYFDRPWYERYFFWNYKIGNTTLSIPKPFLAGVLAGGVEAMLAKMGGHKNTFEGFPEALMQATMPVDEAVIAGPFKSAIDIMWNYDKFRERYIIPPFEKELPVEDRPGKERATRLGKGLASIMADAVDPRVLDHFIQTQFSGMGRMAMEASDIGREDRNNMGERLAGWTGLVRSSPGANSPIVTRADQLLKKKRVRIAAFEAARKAVYEAKTTEDREAAKKRLRDIAHHIVDTIDAQEGNN